MKRSASGFDKTNNNRVTMNQFYKSYVYASLWLHIERGGWDNSSFFNVKFGPKTIKEMVFQ